MKPNATHTNTVEAILIRLESTIDRNIKGIAQMRARASELEDEGDFDGARFHNGIATGRDEINLGLSALAHDIRVTLGKV